MSKSFISELKRNLTSSIPASASIVGEVVRIIYDSSSSALDLARIVEHDPPLSAEILKTANSAFYGATSEITSIRRAVVVLGFDTVKEIATTTATVKYLFNVSSKSRLNQGGLWLHSVGTAKAAQTIAEEIRYPRADVAYTTGLLHDLGKILLALTYPEKYTEVLHVVKAKKCRIILAERRVLNIDHCMIGKLLCDIWIIPPEIGMVISCHHDSMECQGESRSLAQIVSLGDYLCRKAQIGYPGDDLVPEPSPATMGLFGIDKQTAAARLNACFERLMEQKDEIVGFFSSLQ